MRSHDIMPHPYRLRTQSDGVIAMMMKKKRSNKRVTHD